MLHTLTIERGLDPRSYVLFSYGGTAGMHVTAFAQELGVTRIIMPHSASVHGAFGLVTANVTHEEQVTHPLRVPADPNVIDAIFAKLSDTTTRQLRSEGFDDADITISRAIDMRYRRQVHVVTTPVDVPGQLNADDLQTVIDSFNRLYEERFGKGSGYREAGIEMVNFRLRGTGKLRKPELKGQELGSPDPRAAFVERRQAYFSTVHAMREADCYDFERLAPGNQVSGPAIVWTPITTMVINPGHAAWCDQYKNLHVTF